MSPSSPQLGVRQTKKLKNPLWGALRGGLPTSLELSRRIVSGGRVAGYNCSGNN